MKIRIAGTGNPGLDSTHDCDPQPNLREITRFRKEAGLSPSEMLDAMANGGLEVMPLYVYTALQRQGRPDLATEFLDLPIDAWENADLEKNEEEGDEKLPPADGSGSSESEL